MLRLISITTLLAVVGAADYGLDCSFPIQNHEMSCGDLLGDRQKVYDDFMEGCRKFYGDKAASCDSYENDRIEMSYRQAQSMVNYTSTGFKKIKAPKAVWDLLSGHWERNKDKKKKEQWGVGNIYVNHWDSPTYMVSVEDKTLDGGGYELKQAVWDAVKPTIEQWTGMELQPVSMYGIRIYTDGAILNPHVDRLPLVSSCIINVAQDVDEPWPLEVYDRNDRAVNVTMEPGDMVLYESGTLMHGRPFALKGKYYANIFVHFEPTGRKIGDTSNAYLDELDDFLPPYILPGSPEVENWVKRHPHGWRKPSPSAPIKQANSPQGHYAAAVGDVDMLVEIAKKDRRLLHKTDKLGWRPIHEAVRGGHKDAVEMLIKHGAGKNSRTRPDGKGASPLNLALAYHDADHPVVRYLKSIGAKDISEGEL
jgi:hypothetical protein